MDDFNKRIKMREENDRVEFEDSFVRIASSVIGNRGAASYGDERLIAAAAIEEVLKYFHVRGKEIPDEVIDPEDQLEYQLRPHGIMRRRIELSEGWYQNAFGPILAFKKDTGKSVVMLPHGLFGYVYKDFETGKRVRISKKNANLFLEEAISFYRPLPIKSLSMKDIILYIKSCLEKKDIAMIFLSATIVTLLGLFTPRITKILTGDIAVSGGYQALIGLAIFAFAILVTTALMKATQTIINARITTKVSISLEAATMARILSLPVTFFKKHSSGELYSRCRSVSTLCTTLLDSFLVSGITAIFSLIYIFQIASFARALALPSLGIILLTVLVLAIAVYIQMRISLRQMELAAKENGIAYSLISGVQKIKLTSSERRAFARWTRAYADSSELAYNPPLFIKVNSVLVLAITLFGNALLFYLAGKENMSSSDYLSFTSAYGMVSGAFASLAGVALSLAKIRPLLKMAEPIMKEVPEISDDKAVIQSITGNIELSHVSFRYQEDTPWVLDDLSLRIEPGEYVAIVGKTGCGKSTLLRLLLGFETPQKGSIYYDGRDLHDIDLRSLRKRIGTVTQNGSLFQGDIYSNIVISAPQLSMSEAWDAAEIAGIAQDIREMPMGMHTVISEGQGGISGGQKQRLMIARAIAPKPKVLMFDEATSALDNKTQQQVSEALEKLSCTRLIIAHRLSTIKHCDRILLIEDGRIAEDGTYEELISLNGKFAELVARQQLDS